MTDHEINQAIHDHLGLPRTVTRWRVRYEMPTKIRVTARKDTREQAIARQKELEFFFPGGVPGEPEEYEEDVEPKDYCNDRDAMAEVIAGMKEHDTGAFIYELAPGWVDAEIINDELIDFALKMLTTPCRDLAVAFVKTIHPDKFTP